VVLTPTVAAQVVLDGSFGAEGPLTGPDYLVTADLGLQVGPNLFHSFSEFSLANPESAMFSGPAEVDTILSRVTGTQASSIDGSLGTTIAGANLYFINPRGVIFGQNAKLDVSGSFVVSTADHLTLEDGGRFDVTQPDQSVFTSAPVEAFGFLDGDASAIEIHSSELEVDAGQHLSLVGGDIIQEGGRLAVSEGALQMLSAASAGEFTLPDESSGEDGTPPEGAVLGEIHLSQRAEVNAAGSGPSTVWIRGGQLVMEEADIQHVNDGAGDGGRIDVAVSNDLRLLEGSGIVGSTAQAGQGAMLVIQAQTVRAESGSRLATEATETATGRGGDLILTTGSLELVDGSSVLSSTRGAAQGGRIHVLADTMEVDALAKDVDTGVVARSSGDSPEGRAGDVLVEAQDMRLYDGGEVSATTLGLGDAGNVHVVAGDLLVDAVHNYVPDDPADVLSTGVFSRSASPAEGGRGGNVTVEAVGMTILGGELSVSTRGAGDAGSLRVEADQLSIDGQGMATGLFAQSLSEDQSGDAGDLIVEARQIEIINEGRIQVSTFGPGNAGTLTVKADDILIDGHERSFEWGTLVGILAQSVHEGAGGDAGAMVVEAQRLSILTGGGIGASTAGLGHGGDLTVRANEIFIDGEGEATGIFANSYNPDAGGPAGDVRVEAGQLEVYDYGQISAGTWGAGQGGNLTVTADEIYLDDGPTPRDPFWDSQTGIFANSLGGTGDAGNLNIDARQLDVESGASISASTLGAGDGGVLNIQADEMRLNGTGKYSWVAANSVQFNNGGDAGDLIIDAGDLTLTGWSQISGVTYGSGNAGNLTVRADDILVDGQGWFAGFYAQSQGWPQGGAAGNLNVEARNLELRSSSTIDATTYGTGSSGNISVAAEAMVLDGRDGWGSPSIVARTITGEGGDVRVRVDDQLDILGASVIDASTFGPADGGSVRVEASTLNIDGHGAEGGIFAQSLLAPDWHGTDEAGQGGQISVEAGSVSVSDGGAISTSTARQGDGGDVNLVADDLSLSQGSSIQSSSTGGGSAGTIQIQTDRALALASGSLVATSAELANGGNIQIAAGSGISLTDSSISAQAAIDGGNVQLLARDTLYLLDSEITAEAGNDGGNLDLASYLTVLNRSRISANAFQGDGGDILIASPYFLPSTDSAITASSEFGLAGEISVLWPAIDLTGSLTPLEPSLADYRDELPPHCEVNVGEQLSSFAVTGVRGIPLTPAGWEPDWPSVRLRLGGVDLPADQTADDTP